MLVCRIMRPFNLLGKTATGDAHHFRVFGPIFSRAPRICFASFALRLVAAKSLGSAPRNLSMSLDAASWARTSVSKAVGVQMFAGYCRLECVVCLFSRRALSTHSFPSMSLRFVSSTAKNNPIRTLSVQSRSRWSFAAS